MILLWPNSVRSARRRLSGAGAFTSLVGGRLLAVAASFASISCSDVLATSPRGTSASSSNQLSVYLVGYSRDSSGAQTYRLVIGLVDSAGSPVSSALVSWAAQVPTDSVAGDGATGPDGADTLLWVTRDTLVPVHVLEVRSGQAAPLRIAGRPWRSLPQGSVLPGTRFLIDTVRAEVQGGASVQVVGPGGQGVANQTLFVQVLDGKGTVGSQRIITDALGRAQTSWRFGPSAGLQSVQISFARPGALRLVDPTTGNVVPAGGAVLVRGVALPGQVQLLKLGTNTQAFAIGARIHVPALAHDAYGNTIAQPFLTYSSSDTTVVVKQTNGLLRTVAPGWARVYVSAGAAQDSVNVFVVQKVMSVTMGQGSISLHFLGQRAVVNSGVVGLGAGPGVSPLTLESLSPATARVAGADTIVAVAPGAARVIASMQGLAPETLGVTITQVPGAVLPPAGADTLTLDQTAPAQFRVFDSGGTPIVNPALALTSSDTSVVEVHGTDSITAVLPGQVTLSAQSGPATLSYPVTVEGVAVVVNGQRQRQPGVVSGLPAFTVTNGRIRFSWSTAMEEIGSTRMEVRIGQTWYPATTPQWGDWVYIASSVITQPTLISVTEESSTRIAVQMRYDNHWFLPQQEGLPDSLQAVPYPFVRTIWLSKGDNGYYSWVDLFGDLHLNIVEHETGFGGVWGPATIRTGQLRIRTDTLAGTVTYNGNPGLPVMGAHVDAAEFVLDGDPVRRILVPLPEAPFITPVFPGWGYGSVYRYASPSRSFGAYMYAAPLGAGPSVPSICRSAWLNAPFPLHPVSESQFASCGPSGL